MVGRTGARRSAADLAGVRAVGRARRRSIGSARAGVADVRPHPAQGNRAVYPFGRRHAHRDALARGVARGPVAADQRQPLRTDDDFQASDGIGRPGHRQAWRDYARIRIEQRNARPARRGARPRGQNRAQRHRGPARRPSARRIDRAVARRANPHRRQRIGRQSRRIRDRRSAASPTRRARPTSCSARPASASRAGWPRSKCAGTAAAGTVNQAEASFSGALDALLERTSVTLQGIRSGIDAQSAAVSALVEQASAGIGKTGAESAEALGANINRANDVARDPVGPGRRAGARVAADDRRDRSWPRADR